MPPKRRTHTETKDERTPQKPKIVSSSLTKKECVKCISDLACPEEKKAQCIHKFSKLHDAKYSPDSPILQEDTRANQTFDNNIRDLLYPYVKHGTSARRITHKRSITKLHDAQLLKRLYEQFEIFDAPPDFDASMSMLFRRKYKGVEILTLPQLLTYYNYTKYGKQIPEEYIVSYDMIYATGINRRNLTTQGRVLKHGKDYWKLRDFKSIVEWLKEQSTPHGIWVVYIIFNHSSGSHANILVFDNKNKRKIRVSLIDPAITIDVGVMKVFENACAKNHVIWLSSPFSSDTPDFQRIEQTCPVTDIDATGYCQTWVQFIAEAVLKGERYDGDYLKNILAPLAGNLNTYRKFITDYMFSRMVQLHFMLQNEHHPHNFDFEFYRRHIARYYRLKQIVPFEDLS
jgi:hypothetical protein